MQGAHRPIVYTVPSSNINILYIQHVHSREELASEEFLYLSSGKAVIRFLGVLLVSFFSNDACDTEERIFGSIALG